MIVNEGGKKLPKLTTPGTSADLLTGKELIDQYGRKVEGSMPINSNETPTFGTTELEKSGRLRATAIYRKGFYNGGTSSTSYYLPTQAGTTITPGTETITAVPSGKYTLGAVEVAGDSDLKAENIAKGKTIFGVTGIYEGEPRSSKCTFIDNVTIEVDRTDIIYPDGLFLLYGIGNHDDRHYGVIRSVWGAASDLNSNDPDYSSMASFDACIENNHRFEQSNIDTYDAYYHSGSVSGLYGLYTETVNGKLRLKLKTLTAYIFKDSLTYYITFIPGEDVPT